MRVYPTDIALLRFHTASTQSERKRRGKQSFGLIPEADAQRGIGSDTSISCSFHTASTLSCPRRRDRATGGTEKGHPDDC